MIFEQEKEFNKFRKDHPHLRFYEALSTFTGAERIELTYNGERSDVFYWIDLKK